MPATAKALKTFFSGFGIPAYTTDSVPEEAPTRHITYPYTDPEWDKQTTFYCEVWDRATSNEFILERADAILKEIGTGIIVSCDGGFLRIHLENPTVQLRVDGDYRSAYINMTINAFHMPGV